MQVKTDFFSFLNDQTCWGIVAGEGTGSVVELLIGEKIKRERPLDNPIVDSAVREYDPEISIFIQCAWRLANKEKVICSCLSSNQNDGPMLSGLRRLKDNRISSTVLNVESMDLSIRFADDLVFSIFNNFPIESEYDDAYWITSGNRCFAIKDLSLYETIV